MVALLLDAGADRRIPTGAGQLAEQLTAKAHIRRILGGTAPPSRFVGLRPARHPIPWLRGTAPAARLPPGGFTVSRVPNSSFGLLQGCGAGRGLELHPLTGDARLMPWCGL